MTPKQFHIPLNPDVKGRKARFMELNEFVRSRNGWVTSVPGDVAVTVECLPGSSLPDDLRSHDVVEIEEGERIVPSAITERFCIGADGQLEPLTSGSTRPVADVVTHAGICKVADELRSSLGGLRPSVSFWIPP